VRTVADVVHRDRTSRTSEEIGKRREHGRPPEHHLQLPEKNHRARAVDVAEVIEHRRPFRGDRKEFSGARGGLPAMSAIQRHLRSDPLVFEHERQILDHRLLPHEVVRPFQRRLVASPHMGDLVMEHVLKPRAAEAVAQEDRPWVFETAKVGGTRGDDELVAVGVRAHKRSIR
jgi:hypothetical protein